MVFELSEMDDFQSILEVFELQNEMNVADPEDEKDNFWIFLVVFGLNGMDVWLRILLAKDEMVHWNFHTWVFQDVYHEHLDFHN